MYIKNQTFLVIGVSKSGFSACDYILENGGKCFFYEENNSDKVLESIKTIEAKGGKRVSVDSIEKVIDEIHLAVISPGIPINHEIALQCKRKGKRIIGELEFGYMSLLPVIIAVTGTNGKTTTVSLIEHILKQVNEQTFALGNIGIPLSSQIGKIDKKSILVTEVSSFQLESISSFCPHIACVLNVTPDHLEGHYSMENYTFLKKRLLTNQKESEYSVLNFDDEIVKVMFTDTKAKVIWVSKKEKVDGCYIQDGCIFFINEKIIEINDLTIKGEHNEENVMFAIVVCKLLGVESDIIVNGIKSFKGISNRIEYICTKNGVEYYNDSKSTNTASTMSAIKTMSKPTVLILGGREKGETYDELFSYIKKSCVIHVILTGESRFNMLEEAEKQGINNITLVSDFEMAIKVGSLIAKNGEIVLLSPACSSFDSFNSYEERGDMFKKIVESF